MVSTLQGRRRNDALKLKALRASIRAGIEALESGDYDDIEGAGLEAYLNKLAAEPGKAIQRD